MSSLGREQPLLLRRLRFTLHDIEELAVEGVGQDQLIDTLSARYRLSNEVFRFDEQYVYL